jgi:hypothetical protein
VGAWDWSSLAADADRHNVGVLVRQRLTESGQSQALPDAVAGRWLADAQHAALQHGLQRRDATAVSEALTRAGIRHAALKGFAYASRLYEPSWVRFGGDVDILVDRDNVDRVRRLMGDLGFTQAKFSADHQQYWSATPQEILAVESQHYELAEFNKEIRLQNAPEWLLSPTFTRRSPFGFGANGAQQPVFYSSIDVHWALHFVFANASPLDAVREDSGSVPILSHEWNLVFSLFKLYFEAFDRPRFGFTHVADIRALLDSGEIDWDRVDALVSRFGLEAAAYYTIACCESLSAEPSAPQDALRRWSDIGDPQGSSAAANLDFGDFIPYLTGSRAVAGFGSSDRPRSRAGGNRRS